jgi:hypothetical protein
MPTLGLLKHACLTAVYAFLHKSKNKNKNQKAKEFMMSARVVKMLSEKRKEIDTIRSIEILKY